MLEIVALIKQSEHFMCTECITLLIIADCCIDFPKTCGARETRHAGGNTPLSGWAKHSDHSAPELLV